MNEPTRQSLRQLAAAAAEENQRHTAEQQRIADEVQTTRAEQATRETVRRVLGMEAEEIARSDTRDVYFRIQDVWFRAFLPSGGECELLVVHPCPREEGRFHNLQTPKVEDLVSLHQAIRTADSDSQRSHGEAFCFVCRPFWLAEYGRKHSSR